MSVTRSLLVGFLSVSECIRSGRACCLRVCRMLSLSWGTEGLVSCPWTKGVESSAETVAARVITMIENPSHGRTPQDFMGLGDLWLSKTGLNAAYELRLIERLDQVIEAAHPQGFHGGVHGGKSGHDDDGGGWRMLFDGLPEREAV